MGKVKKLMALAMISVMSSSVVGCNMIQQTAESKAKTVLAKIGDTQITLGDVDSELKSDINNLKEKYGENYEASMPEELLEQLKNARTQVLEQLVTEEIMLKKAKELDLIPSDEELETKVNEKTEQLKEVYGGEESFKSALDYYGYTDETFKEFMKTQVISEIVSEDMVKDVTVSDEEVQEYYDNNTDKYTTKPSATTKHILFASKNEDKEAADAEALAQANEIKAKIDSGEAEFDKLFEEYSGNKSEGKYPISESLGTVAYDQANYDKDFLAGLATLGEGEISAPVKSSFGYHIIKATNVVKESTVQSFDEVKDSIKETVLTDKKKEAYNNKLDEWKKELKVKTYENKIS
ncbi:MAG: peptidylprolyl isomerase [Clostridium sp.]|nr:peptidylprolyl isomerase [Clostridium sp.]